MDYLHAFDGANGTPKKAEGIGAFDAATPAPEYTPIPPGVYTARVVRGEFTTTRSGADAYRMRFAVVEGEHAGRTVIRTWTFSLNAMQYTKRALEAFGLVTTAQLLAPFPEPGREYIVRLVVALQRRDNDITYNDIKRIEVTSVTDSPASAYILRHDTEGGPQ